MSILPTKTVLSVGTSYTIISLKIFPRCGLVLTVLTGLGMSLPDFEVKLDFYVRVTKGGFMKPKLLDLFCGAGGAAVGLHRAGFEVVGIDIKPQPHYPFEFHQADALTYPLEGFDAYWASPPCQAYVDTNKRGKKATTHPRLIAPIRGLLGLTDKPYVIENVMGAPLINPFMLCGTMFGLRVIRHRLFECSVLSNPDTPDCNHWGTVAHGDFIGVYGRGGKGPRHDGMREPSPRPPKVTPEEAMGIDWMSYKELTQAVPPAYSEFIGKYLISYLEILG